MLYNYLMNVLYYDLFNLEKGIFKYYFLYYLYYDFLVLKRKTSNYHI